jgi:hypothetical protein
VRLGFVHASPSRRLLTELVEEYRDLEAVVESVDQRDNPSPFWKRVRVVFLGAPDLKREIRAKVCVCVCVRPSA